MFSLFPVELKMGIDMLPIVDAGVVSCGGCKTSSRNSSIVQCTFNHWSYECFGYILRNVFTSF